MKMSKDRVLVAILVTALIVVGALALRGRASFGRGEPQRRVAAATAAAPRPLALAPAARARNPVKVAAAEVAKLAGDIQVVGTVAFHEDHFAVVGPLVRGPHLAAVAPASATRSSAGR